MGKKDIIVRTSKDFFPHNMRSDCDPRARAEPEATLTSFHSYFFRAIRVFFWYCYLVGDFSTCAYSTAEPETALLQAEKLEINTNQEDLRSRSESHHLDGVENRAGPILSRRDGARQLLRPQQQEQNESLSLPDEAAEEVQVLPGTKKSSSTAATLSTKTNGARSLLERNRQGNTKTRRKVVKKKLNFLELGKQETKAQHQTHCVEDTRDPAVAYPLSSALVPASAAKTDAPAMTLVPASAAKTDAPAMTQGVSVENENANPNTSPGATTSTTTAAPWLRKYRMKCRALGTEKNLGQFDVTADKSQEACERSCGEKSTCLAYEFNFKASKCEHHSKKLTHVAGEKGYLCAVKNPHPTAQQGNSELAYCKESNLAKDDNTEYRITTNGQELQPEDDARNACWVRDISGVEDANTCRASCSVTAGCEAYSYHTNKNCRLLRGFKGEVEGTASSGSSTTSSCSIERVTHSKNGWISGLCYSNALCGNRFDGSTENKKCAAGEKFLPDAACVFGTWESGCNKVCCSPDEKRKVRVLFVGNSLTYGHSFNDYSTNFPRYVYEFASSFGIRIETDEDTIGGCQVRMHLPAILDSKEDTNRPDSYSCKCHSDLEDNFWKNMDGAGPLACCQKGLKQQESGYDLISLQDHSALGGYATLANDFLMPSVELYKNQNPKAQIVMHMVFSPNDMSSISGNEFSGCPGSKYCWRTYVPNDNCRLYPSGEYAAAASKGLTCFQYSLARGYLHGLDHGAAIVAPVGLSMAFARGFAALENDCDDVMDRSFWTQHVKETEVLGEQATSSLAAADFVKKQLADGDYMRENGINKSVSPIESTPTPLGSTSRQ
ncbi:unnamed protein product [Amoebophrya sp. A120]|nr:unnamed protein product [Amoebophrya sp. A120]|eukprot:GSA120T00008038001.1